MKAILAFLFSNWKEWDYEECIRFFGCKVFQPLYRTTPDCMPHLLDEKNVRMPELKSRCEIMLENYCQTVLIEANTMIDMAKTEIAPAVSAYVLELANTAAAKKAVDDSISWGYEAGLLKKLAGIEEQIAVKTDELEETAMRLTGAEDVEFTVWRKIS